MISAALSSSLHPGPGPPDCWGTVGDLSERLAILMLMAESMQGRTM